MYHTNTCDLPRENILYCPFSYRDLGNELKKFVAKVYPTYDRIASRPFVTQKDLDELFTYLLQESKEFVLQNPYKDDNFAKIFTLVRADGVVTIDITSQDLDAIMVQIKQKNQELTNANVVRYNSGQPPDIPSTIDNAQIFLTIKQYQDNRIDVFDLFTTRTEYIMSTIQRFGFSSRPAIYVTGQLYCVASLVTFTNGIQAYFRVAYLRTPI